MIFPNPTKGKLTISLGAKVFKNPLVEVASMDGKIIYTNAFQNATSAIIDLPGNSAGICLSKVTADGVSYKEKIEKE